MPIDIDAAVISNTRLSHDYSVLALAAPEIASLAEPGQFVMIKPSRGRRSAAAPAVFDFRDPARCRRNADGHFAAEQANRRRDVAALRRRAGQPSRLSRPARTAVRAGDAAGGSLDGCRGRRAGAVCDAGRSAAGARERRRGCSTARGRAAELTHVELFEQLNVEPVLATEDGSRGAQGYVTAPLEAALRRTPRSTDVRVYACGPTPMMRAVAQARRGARTALRRLARAGHGLRPRRLLQLRRADADGRRHAAFRPIVYRRAGVRRDAHPVGRARALTMDLSVSLGSLTLANPLIAASGCFGYGVEYADVVDLSTLGGVAVKGLFLSEREGHPPPRIVETPAGMLNAIGLQGIGVHRFVREKLPELRDRRAVVSSTSAARRSTSTARSRASCRITEGVAAIELNISCPNIKEGGITFGCSLTGTHDVVSAVRKVTPSAGHPQADAERHRRRIVRARRRRGRRGRGVARQHVSRHGDRRPHAPAEAHQHRRRAERPGDPADRRSHGVRVPSGGEDSDHRHGRHRDAPTMCWSS